MVSGPYIYRKNAPKTGENSENGCFLGSKWWFLTENSGFWWFLGGFGPSVLARIIGLFYGISRANHQKGSKNGVFGMVSCGSHADISGTPGVYPKTYVFADGPKRHCCAPLIEGHWQKRVFCETSFWTVSWWIRDAIANPSPNHVAKQLQKVVWKHTFYRVNSVYSYHYTVETPIVSCFTQVSWWIRDCILYRIAMQLRIHLRIMLRNCIVHSKTPILIR